MIEIGALQALRSVAALGTLVRAADELGFTVSAVSHQIKRLERQVGVPLLAPAGRGVVLTPAGRAIVESAPEVFQSLERCVEAARSVAQGAPQGVIRVVGFSSAICGLLAPALPRLATHCPDLRVHTEGQDPDHALHSIDAGTADLAITHDVDGLPALMPSSVTQRHIHTDIGDVIMKRAHPLAQLAPPLVSAHLAGHAWVTSLPGTENHQWFRRLLADMPETPDLRHLAADFASHLALVASDNVIALIPRLARPPLGEGLVARPLQRPPTREIYAVWRRSADASPAIQAVLAELSSATAPTPEPDR